MLKEKLSYTIFCLVPDTSNGTKMSVASVLGIPGCNITDRSPIVAELARDPPGTGRRRPLALRPPAPVHQDRPPRQGPRHLLHVTGNGGETFEILW